MNDSYKPSPEEYRKVLQDAHINFLLGSGASAPYLKPLGNIEKLLSEVDELGLEDQQKKVIRASLYNKFFNDAIVKNLDLLENVLSSRDVQDNYEQLFISLNALMLKRESSILNKQVNIFTTNFDVFTEKALEDAGIDFNDGFNGRFSPSYNIGNFKKSHFKTSLHYDNTSEIPVFNLLKLHGSLSWNLEGKEKEIKFSSRLNNVRDIKGVTIPAGELAKIAKETTIDALVKATNGMMATQAIQSYLVEYEKLAIVNPTREKFKHTTLNQHYYDLLRVFSNELEKENSALFVIGFSFGDEHIKTVTLRSADSNPTLMIYIFAHTSDSKAAIEKELNVQSVKNNNIRVIGPDKEEDEATGKSRDLFKYDLGSVNHKVFSPLLDSLSVGKKITLAVERSEQKDDKR